MLRYSIMVGGMMQTESDAEQVVENRVELSDVVGAEPSVFIDPLREVSRCACYIPPDFRPVTLAEFRAKHTYKNN